MDEIADSFEDDPNYADYFEITDDDDLSLDIPDGANKFVSDVLDGTLSVTDDEYDEVSSIEERRIRLTEDNLIFASNFTHTKNSKSGINDLDFYQYRIKLESAGGMLSLLTNVIPYNKNDGGQNLVFSVPFSQYVKTEFDFIRHWRIGGEQVIAFRSFSGITIPYGNSNSVPWKREWLSISKYFWSRRGRHS